MANPYETGEQSLVDSQHETTPNTLPDIQQQLIEVPNEAEKRLKLLQQVSVNEKGIATCVNPDTNEETYLAAVSLEKIDGIDQAALLPFRLSDGEDRIVELVLLADKPTRVGFFVGYKSPDDMTVVFRNGEYPGKALNTQNTTDREEKEVAFGVGGMRDTELLQKQTAEQIGLFSLGFEPTRTRGVFFRGHQSNSDSSEWKDSPFVFMPKENVDLLRHYDPDAVKLDEVQVLVRSSVRRPSLYESLFLSGDTLRGGEPFGFPSTRRGGHNREMGLGFGAEETHINPTTSSYTKDLTGAFRIVAISK